MNLKSGVDLVPAGDDTASLKEALQTRATNYKIHSRAAIDLKRCMMTEIL